MSRGISPQGAGRYPDFDVFDARAGWDPATARVIDQRMRVRYGAPTSFFDADEAATGRALCDAVMAQDTEPRVPVLELVDEKLAGGRLDGFRYAGMPDDRDTWRIVVAGVDVEARYRFGAAFHECGDGQTEQILTDFARGDLGGEVWSGVDVHRAWAVCTRMIVAAFYSHPWAWNEIGFGGPAYPRGYMRLGPLSVREPWEKPAVTDEDPVR